MLPDDVGRRADLKVVQLVVIGHQVGVPQLGRVVGGRPDEEGLGGPIVLDRGRHVFPERDEPRLRVVPALLVQDHVGLDDRRLIAPVDAGRVAIVGDAGVGVGRPVDGGRPFRMKLPASPFSGSAVVRARVSNGLSWPPARSAFRPPAAGRRKDRRCVTRDLPPGRSLTA